MLRRGGALNCIFCIWSKMIKANGLKNRSILTEFTFIDEFGSLLDLPLIVWNHGYFLLDLYDVQNWPGQEEGVE